MSKLKNCPFCGDKAEFYHGDRRTIGHNEYDDEVGIKCLGCGVKVGSRNYVDYMVEHRKLEAIKWWNSRV